MRLLWTVGCFGRRIVRHFSPVARPGGEELSRLLLDDLAPTQRLERLFGLSPCLLALRAARRSVARLLLQAGKAGLQGERAELLRVAEARGIPVLRPRRQKLDALCGHQVHQGVCMEVSPLRPRPCDEATEASPVDDPQQLWLVLEGLQDPRNLGAVLRSAHFLGVDRVITSRRNSCPLTPVVSKASAGAVEVMDVFATTDLAGFLKVSLPRTFPHGYSSISYLQICTSLPPQGGLHSHSATRLGFQSALFSASSSVPGANAGHLEDLTHPKSKALSVCMPRPGRAGSWWAQWAAQVLRSPSPSRSPSLAA
ncbi:rRNA methyltransferase 1, mitochondrial isoform X2 [Microtus pennsylvanicus]|uniref:rRNA methyltransferase 1, mitochondrial isoform X2 n=1 Tax=Microtus pennsylvanicus TaxID=10058 RepID=UPI003F6DA4A5